jgi:hypothetical protein
MHPGLHPARATEQARLASPELRGEITVIAAAPPALRERSPVLSAASMMGAGAFPARRS